MKLFKIIIQHVNHRSRVQIRFSSFFLEKLHSAVDTCVPVLISSCVCVCAHSVVQSCPTLCNPMDCSPPGSLSMGFSKQEYWNGLSFPSPRDLFNPGIKHVSYIPCIGRWILSHSFLPTPFFLPYMYKNMGLFLIFFFDYHYGLSDFSPIKCLRISMIIITLFVTKFV